MAEKQAAMTVLGETGVLRDPADLPALEIKLVALVVLLSVTLLFGFVPLCLARAGGRCGADPERRRRLMALISCFSGGVFMATCLLDLLPDFLQSIGEAFRDAGIKVGPTPTETSPCYQARSTAPPRGHAGLFNTESFSAGRFL
uniref:Solute carrier family 39 member 3 n=1 Tax=Xiphophorus couchianus TaxID=32473 RepID=A0A3B5MVF0_9TELE